MAADTTNWLMRTVSGLFGAKVDPLAASVEAMKRAEAFVDPSRLFGQYPFIPYNPSTLVSRKGLAVFDLMKVDEQVKACLAFKKSAILASGWEVVSPGDQEEDWEVTQFVKDVFTRFPGGWHAALRNTLLALDYGYSVQEKVYSSDAPWAEGKLVLQTLNSLKPHYIEFEVSNYGKTIAVVQIPPGQLTAAQQSADKDRGRFPPAKFVVYSHENEFENPYGRSDLEAAHRAWWIKENVYRWFAVFLERYGMAPMFAMYNPLSYQGAQLNNLKAMVKNIQNMTMGIIPRNTPEDLELWSQDMQGGSKELFLAALNRYDADIGRALLVPSLIGAGAGDAGKDTGDSGGSFARSKTHFDSFMLTVAEEQRGLSDGAINSQIIPQLCDLNFPGLTSYPLWRCLPPSDELNVTLFDTWSKLVSGKIVGRVEDDETHIRKVFGFPENENPTLEELPGDVEAKAKAEAFKKGLNPDAPGGEGGSPFAKKQIPKEVPDAEQSAEMRQYAEDHDAVWVTFGDETVAVSAAEWSRPKPPEDGPALLRQLVALMTESRSFTGKDAAPVVVNNHIDLEAMTKEFSANLKLTSAEVAARLGEQMTAITQALTALAGKEPVVHVAAPTVHVAAPAVHVNNQVAPTPVTVKVRPTPVTVNTPEVVVKVRPTPVNVAVEPAKVTVQVPPRKTVADVTYNKDGSISRVVQTDEKQ